MITRRSLFKNERGFTLVEVAMVAMLLAMLAGILYGALNGLMKSSRVIEQERNSIRTAQFVFQRMIRELNGATGQDPLYQAKGRSTAVFLGKKGQGESGDKDEITFVTTNGAQNVFGGFGNFGNVQVTYRLEKDKNFTYNDPNIQSVPTYVLVREEIPAGTNNNKKLIEKKRLVYPIASNVAALGFRFYAKKKWQESWSGKTTGKPEVVEITLKLATAKKVDTLRTAVALVNK